MGTSGQAKERSKPHRPSAVGTPKVGGLCECPCRLCAGQDEWWAKPHVPGSEAAGANTLEEHADTRTA